VRTRPALGIAAALALLAGTARGAGLPGTSTSADRARWRALLHWPASCEAGWRANRAPGAGVVLSYPAASERLAVVECAAAAYQATDVFYALGPGGKVAGPLRLATYDIAADGRLSATSVTEALGIVAFTGSITLTVLDELRSLGDCGLYSTFRLTDDRLVPVAVRAKTRCDGLPPLRPQSWPRVALPPATG
jgi:hypothetical protein